MTVRRIGFLLPHFRAGGAERVVLNWISALDRSRFQPVLFLTKVEGAFLDLLPADVTPVSLGGGRALRLGRRIADALTAERIDIAYSATNAMNLALLTAPGVRAARVVSEHTQPDAYLAEAKLAWLRRMAMRRYYRRADAIAVPTDRIAHELAATLGRPLPTVTLPNPILDEGMTLPVRPPHPVPQIAAAGRLVAAKGFDLLIDACAMLAERGVAFHLTIHGEGPLEADLRARIGAARLDAHVTLAGHADPLIAALATADLFVLSSRREGFGNVVIEAMAAGTPVLATRSGGPQTIIEHGRNGFLVEAGDAGVLADALGRLIADPARARVVDAAKDTARRYGIAVSTRAFEALLDEIGVRSIAA